MPPRNLAILFCWALVLFLSSPAAGVLTIELETTLGAEGDRLRGTLKITNKGDEPALDLRAEIALPNEQLRREITKRLEAKAFASLAFEGRLTGLKNGSYPLPVTVIFHDAKLYPFSALACPVFACGEEGSGDLSCTALPATVGEKGEISFTLKSSSPAARTLQAMVLLPREFQSPRSRFSLTLGPHASRTLSFPVLNTSALQGATYPVFGVFQYETEDLQQALVIPTTLRITEKGNWFTETRWYWLSGVVLLSMITLWRLFKKKIT
jgi:hypothetical protein